MNWFNKFLVKIGLKEVVEGAEPPKARPVLVVLTEREIQEFRDLDAEEKAAKQLLVNLKELTTLTHKKYGRLWNRLRKKYDLPGDLDVDLDTREIRKL